MISSDSFYTIGNGHRVCQDYALSFRTYEGNHAAVVCDGCSSAEHSEVGAALMAHIVKKWAESADADLRGGLVDYCRKAVVDSSVSLGLKSEAFFSTVVYVEYEPGDGFYIDVFGDGVIIGLRRDGRITYTSREFKSGAPFYMAYSFDEDLKSSYSSTYGTESTITNHFVPTQEEDSESFIMSRFNTSRMGFSTILSDTDYRAVLICTDGVSSFQPELSPELIARAFTEFKTTNGKFIERRIGRYLSLMSSEGFKHFDDIGVGGIHV